ncbi:MAG TPA: ADP-glyceromanno-heptose 6-epimerase [Bacteroidales bacterium]|jgi:ADP-L-glycero-D-manno-heptose 6-epimerase|nr:ADP-glyceromanno-heptose 6-epimerase [Bacteroidales bacterium]MDD4394299.1 ADP-glyceromanno-heptose 6-epimerase [Bacteroidales bacterium]HNW67341.1 ADP-glyceromanno-heptose 6-epimerase [Bacteroidales bacterium]HPT52409.1 ADP-glyceromanno-heptose 6-epimerase [Bacteroidales bacterium]
MIVITGAAGFIGSCMITKLNESGHSDLILVDDFTKEHKKKNWINKRYIDKIQRDVFYQWANNNAKHIDLIIHLGARTDTTEMDYSIFEELNVGYSQQMWSFATQHGIPLLYASSAATYGDGKFGYTDDMQTISQLVPLNPYGKSKNEFDKWLLKQTSTPPLWYGFKFFNVFGPNEYHKGRMASVIFHAFNQINETGKVQLFRSHRPDFEDGKQNRDFVYVKDVVNVLYWFSKHYKQSGIYNLGTGFARTFLALTTSTFKAMGLEPTIEFIDIPQDIRDKYQYYTQADIQKLRKVGYKKSFYSLENGVTDYVSNYLINRDVF